MFSFIRDGGPPWTFSNFPTINQVLRGLLTLVVLQQRAFVPDDRPISFDEGEVYLAPEPLAQRVLP